MGQHKSNPNCKLAREGKLPPKPKQMSKEEIEETNELLQTKMLEEISKLYTGNKYNSLFSEQRTD